MRKPGALVVFIVLLSLVAGCTTATTSTTVPPTAAETRVPPTASPVPSTATPTVASPPTAPISAGGLIAFYSHRDGNIEIYTMKPDGSDQRRLTFSPFEDSSPAWSPDGRQLAFISDREDPQAGKCSRCLYQLYLIDVDGAEQGLGSERKLVDTDFAALHPDWHPDGTKLSFDSEFNFQGNVYVVNADGSDLHLLIEDGFWADWSPDGTQIVFASKRDGTVELYVADADGSNQRRLTENRTTEVFPAWSPDGRKIAFTVFERRHIFVMNADGSDERQLTDRSRSENPAWSPDGAYIAFQSSSQGNFEIYIIHVEDALQGRASSLRLTNNRVGDLWPAWGP